jgi:hypothetical protein|tara:strand:+ start:1966 stop:2100 length:135 start_codon:yes stop_codon:yes gene_type:complete
MMIEVIGGIILGVIFLLHLFGAYLMVQDKQSLYELGVKARRDEM